MLTSVDDYVFGQVPHIHKGLATHAALMWSDIVMVADVIGQLAGLNESAGPQVRGCADPRSSGVGGVGGCRGTRHSGTQELWGGGVEGAHHSGTQELWGGLLGMPTTLGHSLGLGLMLPGVGADYYLLPQRSQT